MEELEKQVRKSLALSFDFKTENKKSTFFVISCLCCRVIFKNGKNKGIHLKCHVETKGSKYLPKIIGQKPTDKNKITDMYLREIDYLVKKTSEAFLKIYKTKNLNNKKIETIQIINWDKYDEKNSNSQKAKKKDDQGD